MHIDDFVDLIIKVLKQKDLKGIFNIGSNKSYSLKEIITIFEKKINKKIKYKIKKLRKGELSYTLCDNRKLSRKLGWTPKKNIEDIVNSTIEWNKTKL